MDKGAGKQIVLYTRREGIAHRVCEELAGTGISVIVDTTFRGRFRDPSFVDHRGNEYVGCEPLNQYVAAVRDGDYDPTISNPIGEYMERISALPQRSVVFDQPPLFGDFFAHEFASGGPYVSSLSDYWN